MWDLINNQAPEVTFLSAMMNRLFQGRRDGILFTRSNKKKIGFNCLSNRLQSVSQKLKMNWQDMNKMAFKKLCKGTFIESELRNFSWRQRRLYNEIFVEYESKAFGRSQILSKYGDYLTSIIRHWLVYNRDYFGVRIMDVSTLFILCAIFYWIVQLRSGRIQMPMPLYYITKIIQNREQG